MPERRTSLTDLAWVALWVFISIALSSCTQKPQVYNPPDPSKVIEAKRKLDKSIDSAHVAAKKAQKKTEATKQAAMSLSMSLAEAIKHIDAMRRATPADQLTALNLVETDVITAIAGLDLVISSIAEVGVIQNDLEAQLAQADIDKLNLSKEMRAYWEKAQKLADAASNESAKYAKAQNALNWYRLRWWGSWIALGAGFVLCGIFAFLKFTGRLALKL